MRERIGVLYYLIIPFWMFFDNFKASNEHNTSRSRGHEQKTYTGLGGEGSGRADKSKGKSELHG